MQTVPPRHEVAKPHTACQNGFIAIRQRRVAARCAGPGESHQAVAAAKLPAQLCFDLGRILSLDTQGLDATQHDKRAQKERRIVGAGPCRRAHAEMQGFLPRTEIHAGQGEGLEVAVTAEESAAADAAAQAASGQAEESDTTQPIVVTGSRIRRTDLVGVGPATVVTAESIENTGVVNIETVLQRLPANAGFAGNQTSAYWTGNGYGTAQVNLRGLGIKRTLVLLNGRRLVAGGTGANSSPDLNMIPVVALAQKSEMTTVKVYFLNEKFDPNLEDCNKVHAVERTIPKTKAVARAALEEFFKGVSQEEAAKGYVSFSPAETKGILKSIKIKNGAAFINFNKIVYEQLGTATTSCGGGWRKRRRKRPRKLGNRTARHRLRPRPQRPSRTRTRWRSTST